MASVNTIGAVHLWPHAHSQSLVLTTIPCSSVLKNAIDSGQIKLIQAQRLAYAQIVSEAGGMRAGYRENGLTTACDSRITTLECPAMAGA
jgi:hypothetical protein